MKKSWAITHFLKIFLKRQMGTVWNICNNTWKYSIQGRKEFVKLISSSGFLKDIQSSSLDVGFLSFCSLSKWYHTASVKLRYGLWGGQCKTWWCFILCFPIQVYFSCTESVFGINVMPEKKSCLPIRPFPYGGAWWIKIWQYFYVFIFPSVLTRFLTPQAEMQPQTITFSNVFYWWL